MNEKQRTVVATFTCALIVAALFYIPWRVESTGDLKWAPFHRNPVLERSTLIGDSIDSRFVRLKGQPVFGLYVVQLILIGTTGAAAYWFVRDQDD
jgi:hypothetical protein